MCDEGYLRESDRLCTGQSSSGRAVRMCRSEAVGLFVVMAEQHRYRPLTATPPGTCRQRCAYDFIVRSRR